MWRNPLAVTLALLILVISASAIVALPGETSSLTPGQVVQEFLLDLHKGGKNISKFLFITDEAARALSGLPLGGGDAVFSYVISSNAYAADISKIDILKETADETTARVKAKIVCRDGSAHVKNYLLVAKFGSWRIDFASLLTDATTALDMRRRKAKEEKAKEAEASPGKEKPETTHKSWQLRNR